MNRSAVAPVLLALILAGCASPSEPPSTPGLCVQGTCPVERPPLRPGAAAFDVRATGCTLHDFPIESPRGVFNPDYPPGIERSAATHDWTQLDIWTCEQAIVGSVEVAAFEFGLIYSVVPNPDPAERNATANYVILDTYSNSPLFVETASRVFGWPIRLAEGLSFKQTPMVGNLSTIDMAYPVDTEDYRATGYFTIDGGVALFEGVNAAYYANGTRLGRAYIAMEGEWILGIPSQTAIEFGPGSYWSQHSNLPTFRSWYNPFRNMSMDFWFDASYNNSVR